MSIDVEQKPVLSLFNLVVKLSENFFQWQSGNQIACQSPFCPPLNINQFADSVHFVELESMNFVSRDYGRQ